MKRRTHSVWRHPAAKLVAASVFLASGCSDDSSPMSTECVVDGVTVAGLPDTIAALEPVQLTAQVTGANCDSETVTWVADDGLEIDSDGMLTGTHLGDSLGVTASAGGQQGTAETTVVTAPTVSDSRWALAWMHDETADEYTVSTAGHTYASSTGGVITSVRSGAGRYTVTFQGLGADDGQRESIHVSAYDEPRRCRVLSWETTGADLVVEVRCDDLDGTPVDARFNVLVTPAGSTGGRSAFVTSTAADGEVPAALAHNSEDGTIRVTHVETGRYTLAFGGQARGAVAASGPETFHVTAYGTGTEWCKLGGWDPQGDDLILGVRCFSPDGTPADALFSVLMLERERPANHRLGFVWADEAAEAAYTPASAYSFNSSGGTNTASRSGTGLYVIDWSGLERASDPDAETNLVAAYGTDATYCQVTSWGTSATAVKCYAPNGDLVDSRFTVVWIE